MKIERIISCKKGSRCGHPLSCVVCGSLWQRSRFRGFCDRLESADIKDKKLKYYIIKTNILNTLRDGIEEVFCFMDRYRAEKKRGNIPLSYGRLEVSFGKKSLGFNPHINLLMWDDADGTGDRIIRDIVSELGLVLWSTGKENENDTIKSIVWYMLKHNKIGIEKGEAVRAALNKRNTILHTKEFNTKYASYTDSIIDIDFRFMGVYPIRSKEEIRIREMNRQERSRLNRRLRRVQEKNKI